MGMRCPLPGCGHNLREPNREPGSGMNLSADQQVPQDAARPQSIDWARLPLT
jgi:hypothetical protein